MVWNPTIDEIKKELQRENPDRIWDFDDPALTNALNKAQAEGYKQGQKDATNRIFEGLQSHAYILIKPPKGATRKENVALDLTKAEFEDFKKQFEVN